MKIVAEYKSISMNDFDLFLTDIEALYQDKPEIKEFTILEKWDDGMPKVMYIR